MIPFKFQNRSFNVPNSYNDITCGQLQEILDNELQSIELVSFLTGLSKEELSIIDTTEIVELLSFIRKHPIEHESIEESTELIINDKLVKLDEDLTSYSWAQKIIGTNFLSDFDFLSMVAVYLDPLLSDEKFNVKNVPDIKSTLLSLTCEDVYSVAKFIKRQLIEINERESRIPRAEPTNEMIRAGIDMFEELGEFNLIYDMANGDPTKYEAVLELEYSVIFNTLVRKNKNTIFENRYSEIMHEKSKRND